MSDYFEWIDNEADADMMTERVHLRLRMIEFAENELEGIDGDTVAETERQD